MNEQFHVEDGFHHEADAIAAFPVLKDALLSYLRQRGYAQFAPPEMPQRGQFTGRVDGEVRMLYTFVVSPFSPWFNKFAVRVDTLAKVPK